MNEEQKDLALAGQEGSVPPHNGRSLMDSALAAATDPRVEPEKVKLLLDMAKTLQDREAERRFRMAKQAALLQMPSITKRGAIVNHKTGKLQSRYAKFEDIHRVVKPILAQHRLTISFNLGSQGQMPTVEAELAYADTELAFHETGGALPVAVDTTGSKNATQGAGSSVSYGKRQAMKAMLNIIEDGEDDDGAGAEPVLPDDRQALVDRAREATVNGSEAYVAFFNGLPKDDKGFLAYAVDHNGRPYHEQNKEAALRYD